MNTTIITCPTCRITGPIEEFDQDKSKKGVWCPNCCTYIWFDKTNNTQQLTLLLEQKTSSAKAEEVKSIFPTNINKHLSPLRYPGGKSRLINYLLTKVQKNKCDTFVEVFAGGCSFGLALLDAGIINRLIINDKDKNLIIFWNEVINNKETLISKLQSISPTHDDYIKAKKQLTTNAHISSSELAWAYLLVNRLSYSGIQNAGCMGGKNGTNKALLARYNPQRLIKQINQISELKDKIKILNQDYTDCIQNYYWDDKTTLFIDPPYYKKGKTLYHHYFTEKDHYALSELITNLTLEFPNAADILITYDNTEFIKTLYYQITPTIINRTYSI